jgi:hypothetical protein
MNYENFIALEDIPTTFIDERARSTISDLSDYTKSTKIRVKCDKTDKEAVQFMGVGYMVKDEKIMFGFISRRGSECWSLAYCKDRSVIWLKYLEVGENEFDIELVHDGSRLMFKTKYGNYNVMASKGAYWIEMLDTAIEPQTRFNAKEMN